MSFVKTAFALTVLVAQATTAAACPPGLHRATAAELFFGRDIEGGVGVSDGDWRAFLDREVSPRFPRGLSVSDVYGQWRGPRGQFVHEPSKALFLTLTGAHGEGRRLDAVRTAYKHRFHQQSVLLVEQKACISF